MKEARAEKREITRIDYIVAIIVVANGIGAIRWNMLKIEFHHQTIKHVDIYLIRIHAFVNAHAHSPKSCQRKKKKTGKQRQRNEM